MRKLREMLDKADINQFRFWTQIFFFALFIYGGWWALNWSERLPVFACAFVQDRCGSCYLLGLQHQMTAPVSRMFSLAGLGILTGFLTFLIWFVLLNKAWCGYACPLGTLQDWITKIRSGIGVRRSQYSETGFKRLKRIKYALLILLILIPLAIGNTIFGSGLSHEFEIPFCMICPGRTVLPIFNADFSQLMIDFSTSTKMILTALGMAVTGGFFVGAFVKKRFFCLFCPMSALQYLLSRLSVLRLVKDGGKCTRCNNCVQVCDVGIRQIAENMEKGDILQDDCMLCLKCVAACPENDCLQLKFLNIPVFRSTDTGFFCRMEKKERGI